jgi:hypothetical protein
VKLFEFCGFMGFGIEFDEFDSFQPGRHSGLFYAVKLVQQAFSVLLHVAIEFALVIEDTEAINFGYQGSWIASMCRNVRNAFLAGPFTGF